MSVFSKIKEAFVKSEDKDKYLSGLDRSKKSFGDRMRALSNNFHGIDDDLLDKVCFFINAKSSLYNRLLDIAKTAFQKQLTSKSTVF